MSIYIYNEIWLFVRAFAGGAVLILASGNKKAHFLQSGSRRDFGPSLLVCAGLLVFAGIYRINQGILRSFLFLGIISGAFLTYLTIKPLFEKICYIILEVPVRFVKKTSKKYINWLLFFCKRCKILVRQSANQYKNSTRNRLQMRRGRKFGKIREKTKKKDNRV